MASRALNPSQYADTGDFAQALDATRSGLQGGISAMPRSAVTPVAQAVAQTATDPVLPHEKLAAAANASRPIDPARVATTVTLGDGTVVSIQKCRVRQFPVVANLLAHVLRELGIKTATIETLSIEPDRIVGVIHTSFEPFLDTMAALTSLSHEDCMDMDLEDFASVAMTTWEVNRDYFFSRILPTLRREEPVSSGPDDGESPFDGASPPAGASNS